MQPYRHTDSETTSNMVIQKDRQTYRIIVRQKDRQSQGQIGRKKQMDQWKDKRNGETVADKKTDTWS